MEPYILLGSLIIFGNTDTHTRDPYTPSTRKKVHLYAFGSMCTSSYALGRVRTPSYGRCNVPSYSMWKSASHSYSLGVDTSPSYSLGCPFEDSYSFGVEYEQLGNDNHGVIWYFTLIGRSDLTMIHPKKDWINHGCDIVSWFI
ncbi:hypothetical protein LXL04_003958 [Taraxacum kok-saghyz]